ncbi:MAG: cupin domain-containing protein [Halobacteriales archaeon]|nr:cupin domain-containing protein [Halobacteriales archaeon]
MSYHVLDPDDLPGSPDHPCDRRSITEAVGLHALQLARYELAPGETLATEYHSHDRREEAFYVLSGTLVVETPERTYEVPADRLFVVTPDSPLRPYNPASATEPVRVLGIGAPLVDIGQPYRPAVEDVDGPDEDGSSPD